MEIDFKIKNDGTPPIVYVDGQQLAVVHFTYSYHTKTDKVEGSNLYIVDGYLEGSYILRRFLHDIKTGLATEVSLNPLENETGRIFEVCVDIGNNIETEEWIKIPFNLLQPGDIIRIKDEGTYYYDLNGNGIWIVVESPHIDSGVINVISYREHLENQLEKEEYQDGRNKR